jgi:hypothetical protein
MIQPERNQTQHHINAGMLKQQLYNKNNPMVPSTVLTVPAPQNAVCEIFLQYAKQTPPLRDDLLCSIHEVITVSATSKSH